MEAIHLFLASFLVVFLLGIQQLNIQHRRYLAAMATSIGITGSNYILFKILPSGDIQFIQFLWYSLGGALGIVTAMWIHDALS
jgi:hypothetical protein